MLPGLCPAVFWAWEEPCTWWVLLGKLSLLSTSLFREKPPTREGVWGALNGHALEHLNVTLFGTRVFADKIKFRI